MSKLRNLEELKEAIRNSSFNESHLSKTQVVDLETVIELIEDFKQCNIPDVAGQGEQLQGFFEFYKQKFGGGFITEVLEITLKQYQETL